MRTTGEVELSVVDDGTGIAESAGGGAGMGLRIMAYRARMIGGRLEVGRAGAEGGTVVRCVVPAGRAVGGSDGG
jgi:signal transduction histidine kinase